MRIPDTLPRGILCCVALFISSAAGLKADSYAYAMVQNSSAATFGTLDLSTGAFTAINNSELFGLTLAWFGGSLYALQENGGQELYQVNTTNGDLTNIGSLSPGADLIGSTSSGLYAQLNNNSLYSLDPSNAAATLIGTAGSFAPPFDNWYALSNNGSALYFSAESTLYTVAGGGAITAVGTNYGTPVQGDGVAEMGALLVENGILYGGDESGGFIVRIDPSTGVASNPVALQGTFAGEYIYGLAADPLSSSVPEPTSVLLLSAMLLAVAIVTRKRIA